MEPARAADALGATISKGDAALPVFDTLGFCFDLLHRFQIRQEQERNSSRNCGRAVVPTHAWKPRYLGSLTER